MSYLVNLALEDRRAVVVGGGSVAARKVAQLLEAGARVTVIAPKPGAAIERWAARGQVRLRRRPYRAGDVDRAVLVVAATDDRAINVRVSRAARRRRALVNVVDDPALCTFTLPAVVRRGDLTLAVATQGRCPAFAGAVRRELAVRYGPEYGRALAYLARVRQFLRKRGWSATRVQTALAGIYAAGLVASVRDGDRPSINRLVASATGTPPGRC